MQFKFYMADGPTFFIQYGATPQQFRGFYLMDFLSKVLPFNVQFQELEGNILITAPEVGKTDPYTVPSDKFYNSKYATLDLMVDALRAEISAIETWYNTSFTQEGIYDFPQTPV